RAFLADQAFGLFRIPGFIQVAEGDVRTFAGEVQRHRAADAAVAAGDDRHLAFKAPRAAVTVADALRLRPHRALVARLIVLLLRRLLAGLLVHGPLRSAPKGNQPLHAVRTWRVTDLLADRARRAHAAAPPAAVKNVGPPPVQ